MTNQRDDRDEHPGVMPPASASPETFLAQGNNGTGNTNGKPARPIPSEPRWDSIPAQLKALQQWVCWRYEFRDGRWTKVLYHPNGSRARSTDAATWVSFEQAQRAYAASQTTDAAFDGVGFVLKEGGGIVGFDFDHCLKLVQGTIEITKRTIAEYVAILDSYTETSPSGDGLRVLAFGELPSRDRKLGRVEMYSAGRFLTITGNHFADTPTTVHSRQEEIEAIHTHVFEEREAQREAAQAGAPKESSPIAATDEQQLALARQSKGGAKFAALYDRGDWRNAGYPSPSEAHLALCGMLRFWLGPDPDRIDAAFRNSALYGPKWDRNDYAARTIERALPGDIYSRNRAADAETKTSEKEEQDAGESDAKAPKQADILIGLARQNAELFHDGDQAFASLTIAGHRETYPLRSTDFRRALLKLYFDGFESAPNGEALATAVNTLDAICRYRGETRKVCLRVGGEGDKLYLDLCDDRWQIIEISKDGWQVIEAEACPIRFRRTKGMRSLPSPIAGGSIKDLRPFLNVSDSDFILAVAWVIACFRDRGPYPVLIFGGQQGSAKSTNALVLRNLIDPNASPLRSAPKELRDLMIAATNGWIPLFDNLTYIPDWLSDGLCRVATGGGLSTRALFTDAEEMLFEVQRPAMLIGIEDLATKGDLLDRSILINPPPITEKKRKTEKDFHRAFEAARPKILGALLAAVATALRNVNSVKADCLPRMADFAVWVSAAEEAFGWEPGTFSATYKANRESAHEVALENSVVAPVLMQIVDDDTFTTGTASDLLQLLNNTGDEKKRLARAWPKTSAALSNSLKRLAPHLLAIGIRVVFERTKTQRVITIERIPAEHAGKRASSASPPSRMTMG
jgi:primase-polymerase (primpol)-like protein